MNQCDISYYGVYVSKLHRFSISWYVFRCCSLSLRIDFFESENYSRGEKYRRAILKCMYPLKTRYFFLIFPMLRRVSKVGWIILNIAEESIATPRYFVEWKYNEREGTYASKVTFGCIYISKCPCIIGISILSMANGFDKNIGNSGWSKGLEKPKIGGDGRNDVAAATSVHDLGSHPQTEEALKACAHIALC